jgi:hypothetical protein
MGSYASVTDIQARLPDRLDATSKPSLASVGGWIQEAEAMLNGALAGEGLPAPYTDASAVLILRTWVCEYVEGRVRMAQAALGGDGSNDDGKDLVDKFFARLQDIGRNASSYGGMLAAGSAPSASVRVRASNADGELEPEFDRDQVW